MKEKLEEVKIDGIILDFVRFPSPANDDFFYSCFCGSCGKTADSLGYDFKSMRKDVENFYQKLKKEVIAQYVEKFFKLRSFHLS